MNFGHAKTSTSFSNLWEYEHERVPQDPDWCWGIMQAEIKYHIRDDGSYIIDDTTVWKTCECAPMVPPRACKSPIWTQMDSVGLTGILHVKWCKVEHKCLMDPDEQYKTCNQAYLEKCKDMGPSNPRKTLKEIKDLMELWLTICYTAELPPCKTAKV